MNDTNARSTKVRSDMATPILRANKLVKSVPTAEGLLTILDGVDVEINSGEAVAILGQSGSGKTTLLGLLAGLGLPTSGTVHLDGEEITAMSEEERAKVRARCVGFVFQTFQLIDSLTALENVMLPAELRRDPEPMQAASRYLERVGLAERTTHYPRQLSGGEQQRVAMARAFASRPRVLFADEPTGNLDLTTGARIVDLLFELNREEHTTLVLVTHDESLAGRCDRRMTLAEGRTVP